MDHEKLQKEVLLEIKKLAQPTNFADLESRGLISKKGNWYRIHKIHDLPEYVAKKIHTIEWDSKGVKVKFTKDSKFEKLAKRLEKRTATHKNRPK